jgi:hypothetical protein
LSHDSENEGEMESPKEVDSPCCTIEDEGVVPEDETMMNEVLETPAQEETISFPPPLVFDDVLPYDEGNDEEVNEFSKPTCYDTNNDIVDNIDEFIRVGRRRWDAVNYDMEPIYDIKSHLQVLPLQALN